MFRLTFKTEDLKGATKEHQCGMYGYEFYSPSSKANGTLKKIAGKYYSGVKQNAGNVNYPMSQSDDYSLKNQ